VSDDRYKYCPKCGAEYFAHVEVCADCGVPLVHDPPKKNGLPPLNPTTWRVSHDEGEKWKVAAQGLSDVEMEVLAPLLEAESVTYRFQENSRSAEGLVSGDLEIPPEHEQKVQRILDRLRGYETAVQSNQRFVCDSCGKEVRAEDPFCPHCGRDFVGEAAVCSNCGGEVSEDDEVCPHCGEPFTDE